MKKSKILLALFCVLLLSTACAKKQTHIPTDNTPPPPETSSAIIVAEAAQAITDGVIYFDYNMYDIRPEYRAMLQQKADLMRQNPSIRVRIEGNCDARGTQEYNLALGERRARAAYEYLVLLGVNPDQLEMISYGKERPVSFGNTPTDYDLNRRDNFNVIAY